MKTNKKFQVGFYLLLIVLLVSIIALTIALVREIRLREIGQITGQETIQERDKKPYVNHNIDHTYSYESDFSETYNKILINTWLSVCKPLK